MGTASKVIAALQAQRIRKVGSNPDRYRLNSPFRAESNSHAFVLMVEDEEHGGYYDHARSGSEHGSLYELANRLGIEIERRPVESSKRAYTGLADYAEAHGITEAVLRAAKWEATTHKNRPALAFPTASGTRWRFLDNDSPKYINVEGYKACWYGLSRATEKAPELKSPLVLCNGEISTIVAQHYGVPACATTSGEKQLAPNLLAELNQAWAGDILIAFDCDAAGREAARKVFAQLNRDNVFIVDLGLSDGGDIADFCRLHDSDSLSALLERHQEQIAAVTVARAELGLERARPMVTWRTSVESAMRYEERLNTPRAMDMPLPIPFTTLHKFGGYCKVFPAGKMIGVVGISGGGKTSFVETWIDHWCMTGENHTLFWGAEWTWEETTDRRVQRHGGASMTQMSLHELWLSEEQRGVPPEQRSGERMNDELLSRSRRIAREVGNWTGQTFYIEQMDLDLEDLIDACRQKISELEREGAKIRIAAWDYAQLLALRSAKSESERVVEVMRKLKSFCVDYRLIGVVASQVTKNASRDVRQNDGVVQADDAQYLRTDPLNLVLTLTPRPAKSPEQRPRGVIRVDKNSGGVADREVWVFTEPERLKWTDNLAPVDNLAPKGARREAADER